MRQYQQARIWEQIKYSFATIFILAFVIFVIVKEDMQLINKYFRMAQVRDKANKDEMISEEANRLSQSKMDLINSDRGIEGYVRAAYPVVKNGEGVVTLYNASTTNVSEIEIADSWSVKFKNWLNSVYKNAILNYNNHK